LYVPCNVLYSLIFASKIVSQIFTAALSDWLLNSYNIMKVRLKYRKGVSIILKCLRFLNMTPFMWILACGSKNIWRSGMFKNILIFLSQLLVLVFIHLIAVGRWKIIEITSNYIQAAFFYEIRHQFNFDPETTWKSHESQNKR
jgi:hypothetical protein